MRTAQAQAYETARLKTYLKVTTFKEKTKEGICHSHSILNIFTSSSLIE